MFLSHLKWATQNKIDSLEQKWSCILNVINILFQCKSIGCIFFPIINLIDISSKIITGGD